MSAKIVINRNNEWVNRRRNFTVWIDGKPAGGVAAGCSVDFPVEPGVHTVQCKINWCGSRERTVTASDAAPVFLSARSGMKYYVFLYILILIALLSRIGFNLAHVPQPTWLPVAEIVLIVPGLLYILYYLTLGRKDYVVLGDEKEDDIFK